MVPPVRGLILRLCGEREDGEKEEIKLVCACICVCCLTEPSVSSLFDGALLICTVVMPGNETTFPGTKHYIIDIDIHIKPP